MHIFRGSLIFPKPRLLDKTKAFLEPGFLVTRVVFWLLFVLFSPGFVGGIPLASFSQRNWVAPLVSCPCHWTKQFKDLLYLNTWSHPTVLPSPDQTHLERFVLFFSFLFPWQCFLCSPSILKPPLHQAGLKLTALVPFVFPTNTSIIFLET